MSNAANETHDMTTFRMGAMRAASDWKSGNLTEATLVETWASHTTIYAAAHSAVFQLTNGWLDIFEAAARGAGFSREAAEALRIEVSAETGYPTDNSRAYT